MSLVQLALTARVPSNTKEEQGEGDAGMAVASEFLAELALGFHSSSSLRASKLGPYAYIAYRTCNVAMSESACHNTL